MRKFFRTLWRVISFPFRVIIWIFRVIQRWITHLATDIRTFFTEEIEDTPLPETLAKTAENPMGLLSHLNDLRKHLFRAVLFMAVTTAFSFTFSRQILEILSQSLPGGIEGLVAIDVTEPIGTLMRISLLSGFSLALPYIVFELYRFIAPGVSRKARIWGCLSIPIVVVFFLGGMAFAYFVMMPAAIPFLLNVMGITTQVRPSSYISFVTSMIFWLGLAFEFPLVIFVLAGMGVVKAKSLTQQWRLAIVIIAVLSAAITPTVDPVNMSLVMGPLIILYFMSIGLAYLAQRNRNKT